MARTCAIDCRIWRQTPDIPNFRSLSSPRRKTGVGPSRSSMAGRSASSFVFETSVLSRDSGDLWRRPQTPRLRDRRGECRTEPVPPKTHSFVADNDAPYEQEIFDLPQRKQITDVHHHLEANYLRRTVEVAVGILYPARLRTALSVSSRFSPTLPDPVPSTFGRISDLARRRWFELTLKSKFMF